MPATPPPPRVAVFDVDGTLLDVHATVAHHAARIGTPSVALSSLWRRKQLEHGWILAGLPAALLPA